LLFIIGLEGKVVEAVFAAEALQKTLDAEVAECSTLEAIVASACEGLGVKVGPPGSSLGGRIKALYSQVSERTRDALHTGVKIAVSMVSSHYVGIDLLVLSEGYVVPDDEKEAWEEVPKLSNSMEALGDALPLVCKSLKRKGHRALITE
jgi:hypothetical protein